MLESSLRPEISQGDIFADFPIMYYSSVAEETGQEIVPPPLVRRVPAILLTYDCDFDKPQTKWVHVAEILPISAVPLDMQGHIRKGRAVNILYIPATQSVGGEAFVDFRRIERTTKDSVVLQAERGLRIESLSVDGRKSLRLAIAQFFGLRPGAVP